jgi:hypothetical protein
VDSKGVRWDTNHPDYTGYFMKKSRWMRELRKRFFILKGSKLFFAKDSSATPHGVIDLVECVNVKSLNDDKNGISIELKTETIIMFAMNKLEREQWVTEMSKAITRHSCLYISEDG